jgi:hypothetical protein
VLRFHGYVSRGAYSHHRKGTSSLLFVQGSRGWGVGYPPGMFRNDPPNIVGHTWGMVVGTGGAFMRGRCPGVPTVLDRPDGTRASW